MIMETYRLTTTHRSFPHLYDTQFHEISLISRSMPWSHEIRNFLDVLVERRSCYPALHGSFNADRNFRHTSNAITINGPRSIIGSKSYGVAPTSSPPGGYFKAHPDRGPQALGFGFLDDDDLGLQFGFAVILIHAKVFAEKAFMHARCYTIGTS